MLLQKVHNETDKSKSGNGLKVVLYIAALGVAYFAGYYERPKPAPVEEGAPQANLSSPNSTTPAEDAAASVPLSTPAIVPVPSATATPGIIGAMTPPQTRVEKAAAVTPTSAPVAAPADTAVAAVPIKQAGQVTITQPVEIPVKQGGKITGYINLQRGQVITPVGVDHDQIKIKSGDGYVMVPVSSTDMAH